MLKQETIFSESKGYYFRRILITIVYLYPSACDLTTNFNLLKYNVTFLKFKYLKQTSIFLCILRICLEELVLHRKFKHGF